MVDEIKKTRTQKETIEVDKGLLQTILKKVEDIEKDNARLKEDNEKLLAVADKKRVADFEVKNNPKSLVKQVKVWSMDGKLITNWKMVTNKVIANLHRNIVEADQTVKVFFEKTEGMKEGDNEAVLLYKSFIDSITPVFGEVIKVISDDDNTVYVVQFEDGKELEINVNFVN